MPRLKLFLALYILLGFQGLAMAQETATVSSFAYQLQNIDLSPLKSSNFDLIVIDYSRDGSDEKAYARSEIEEVISGKPNRRVISYLSIGEAEDYRFYFKRAWVRAARRKTCGVSLTSAAPSWMDAPNRNWCGNYKTRYWERAWKKIIYGVKSGRKKSYLDRIIDAGFQGVYLDIIDGYEYWLHEKPKDQRRKTAARHMANLVIGLSKYARITRGISNFVIVPQNGAGILDELSPALRTSYLSAINGIGAEDTFFFGDQDENNDLDPQEETLTNLRRFQDAGKFVLSIDYLNDPTKIQQFATLACAKHFIPQVSTRNLDSFSAQVLTTCP